MLVLIALIIYVSSTHLLRLRRNPTVSISWVITLILLPYLTLPLYLMFGIRKVNIRSLDAKGTSVKHQAYHSNHIADETQKLAAAMDIPIASSYDQLNIHSDGSQSLQALRHMIDAATSTIDICTFIFANDVVGDEIAQKLKQKAENGIQVRLLVDGVGAYLSNHLNFKSLIASGVKVALFSPLFRIHLRGRSNLRNHRKMCIIDNQWLWSGGRNIASEYFEGEINKQPWIDLSFDLKGNLVRQAQWQFEQDWLFAITGSLEKLQHAKISETEVTTSVGQIIASGPDQVDDTFYSLLISSIFKSDTSIMLVTPYFVPDSAMLMALTLAARKGVEVNLVLPKKSNHRLADLSRHRALRELTFAGAKVWLLPQMIHAKVVVIDHHLAFVGSANLDQRSLFLNYELMFAFYNPADVKRFSEWTSKQQNKAVLYKAESPGFLRDLLEGLLLWLAFQL
jgi:cardiolipin synthase A/B